MSLSDLTTRVEGLEGDVNTGWTLFAGALVFFMQAGFTFLESGFVKRRNIQSILMKNIIDASMAAIAWWWLGFGLAFGEDSGEIEVSSGVKVPGGGFAGTSYFAPSVTDFTKATPVGDGPKRTMTDWFFQYTFCATAATIVSGGVAERCQLRAFAIMSFMLTLIYYPIVVHWTWGDGFLAHLADNKDHSSFGNGFVDFAGSGIVHMFGGFAALMGAIICGPRYGRFEPGREDDFAPSNMLYIAVGAFILWFGWYGFNAGSTVALAGGASVAAARCSMNTALSAAFGSVASFGLSYARVGKFEITAFANGILGGLVSITAGCASVDTWNAMLTGIIGGLVVEATSQLLLKLKIDDPVGAFPVHGACGVWGVIAVGLFDDRKGAFYGEPVYKALGPNITGIICIALWSMATSGATFAALRAAGFLLVTPEDQMAGLDNKEFSSQRLESKDMQKAVAAKLAGATLACEQNEVKGVVELPAVVVDTAPAPVAAVVVEEAPAVEATEEV